MKRVNMLMVAMGVFLIAFSAAAQPRIAIIDLRKVFDEYHKTKSADATLKDRAADLEKERKTMMEQYRKATDDYKRALDDANDQTLSAEEREKRKRAAESRLLEIQSLEQSVTDFDRTARASMEEQQRSMREKILLEIRGVVNAKAKAGGYTLVLDTAAETINRTPVVLYHTGDNDLTAEVLAHLNATVTAPAAPELKKR